MINLADWEVRNKIDYSPNGDDVDRFSLKVRDELNLIYNLLNRLRKLDASAGEIQDTVAYQLHADTASGRLLIRSADNQSWFEVGKLGKSFLGITPEDIGAVRNTGTIGAFYSGNARDLPSSANTHDIFYAFDERRIYYYTGTSWEVFLSLNFADLYDYEKFCVARTEVDYSGKDKILRLDKNTGKANVDIAGSPDKLLNCPIEVANFKTGDVLVYDATKGKIVNMPKDEVTRSDISATGEANKLVQTDSNGVAHVSISGSAAAVGGVAVSLSGVRDGQILIYDGATKKITAATDITGSAQKINGVGLNVNALENGKAVAYDARSKMLVADSHEYLQETDTSDSGEVGKLIRLGSDKIIHADIDGSAAKISGVVVDVTGMKDGQVLIYDAASKTLKPANKDYVTEKIISETGEVGKLIRLGSDKIVHANLDGSAAKIDGVEVDTSGLRNGNFLSYDGVLKKFIPTTIDLSKLDGVAVDTSGLLNGQVLAFDSRKNKFVPVDKDFVTAENISATGEANKLVLLDSEKIIHADIDGSASILGGVAVNVKSINDGDTLVYHEATNTFLPEAKNSVAGEGKYLVLKKGETILCEYNGGSNVELDISPLTETVGEAEKLKYARKIILTGKAQGEVDFDGSKNVELNVTKIQTTYAETSDSANLAAKAEKLKTARNISIEGKVTAQAVQFDGSSDIVLNVTEMDSNETAKKLETARKILITGDAEGLAYFDGSGDVTIELTVLKSAAVTAPVEESSFAKLAGSANYAAESAKALSAVNDGNGNNISQTYATKTELAAAQLETDDVDLSGFITRAELMEILAAYVTKTELANATVASAAKLTTARAINLRGAVTGSANFDGSADVLLDTEANTFETIGGDEIAGLF